ncbi:MAG: B12-binding domain-containing radical SAM protein [archaeon]|nr:MAG: B12-binding domain-containing radical SAM protein [archaeon]
MGKLKHILAIVPTGFLSKSTGSFHSGNLAAPILRSLTPRDVKITLIDEQLGGKIPWNTDAEMVLLVSVITSAAPKAYRIANIFKKKGKVVGMGGPHPSVDPKEVLEFADFVGIGELEGYWSNILKDFEKGKLKKMYKNTKHIDLATLPYPDRRIIQNMKKKGHKKEYLFTTVTYTTRGCPYNCSFCTVTNIFGSRYRLRPVRDVVDDLKKYYGGLRKFGFILFVDDNIWAVPRYAKELFRALIKEKIRLKWLSQASLHQASDLELLKLAKKAGCAALFIGYESVTPESLNEASKKVNDVGKFKKLTKNIHEAGMLVIGSFVLGFDHDTIESIKATVKFAVEANIDYAEFCILTPFYNTVSYDKMKKEGRMFIDGAGGGKFHDNWSFYTFTNVVFKPKNFTPEELKKWQVWAYTKFHGFRSLMIRLTGWLRHYPFYAPFLWFFNMFERPRLQDTFDTLRKEIRKWEKKNNIKGY